MAFIPPKKSQVLVSLKPAPKERAGDKLGDVREWETLAHRKPGWEETTLLAYPMDATFPARSLPEFEVGLYSLYGGLSLLFKGSIWSHVTRFL